VPAGPDESTHPAGPWRRKEFSFFPKKSLVAVDGVFSTATLLTPPEAGLPLVARRKELVLAYFGTANWNSILSRHDKTATRLRRGRCELSAGDQIGFFCGLEEA
jgi:hypothetical protein